MSADPRAAIRAEQLRRAAILREIDLDGPVCECGVGIDVHPPLAAPGPLFSRRPSGHAHRHGANPFGGAMGR